MHGFNRSSVSKLLLFLVSVFASCKRNSAELLIDNTLSDASLEFVSYIVHAIWDHGMELSFEALWGCEHEHRVDSAMIPTDEVWGFIRYTYERTVGRKLHSPGVKKNLGGAGSLQSGFQVAVNITHNRKGRGVVAAQPIKAGTLVYDPHYFTGEFLTAAEYRRFLQALPPYLVCDILMWSYVRMNVKQEPRICIELDSSCMFNDADDDEIPNLIPGRGIGRYSGCNLELVAKSDIAEGEELMLDYAFSEGSSGWIKLFGLGKDHDVEDFPVNQDIALYYDGVAKWWDGNHA